jgi:hypothetical protein
MVQSEPLPAFGWIESTFFYGLELRKQPCVFNMGYTAVVPNAVLLGLNLNWLNI